MSVRIMSRAWDTELPTTEKMVLLALADWSNDDGYCWPSIAQLKRKSGLSERAVQGAIKRLCADGHLVQNINPGKGASYIVQPITTPAADAPPQDMRPAADAPTPAAGADNTLTNHHCSKVSTKPQNTKPAKADPFPRPDWAGVQLWNDFLVNRKAKRQPNTATAHKRFLDDVARWSDDEWPPPRLLEHAVAKGWAGIYDPREKQDGRTGTNAVARVGAGTNNAPGIGRTGRAALAAREQLRLAGYG